MQEAIAPRRVLIVYWTPSAPTAIRAAIRHHLEAIEHGPSSHQVTFWNAFDGTGPLIRRGTYDAVILHTTLLCLRWFDTFPTWRRKLSWLAELDCLKIAMPQDEYNHSEILDEWLRDLGVGHVFSNFGTDVRHLLYPHTSQQAAFQRAFTGYIDEDVALRLETRLLISARRPLDVVYRATHLPYWLGSLGQLKYLIGERAHKEADARGLTSNISTRADDAILGDEWFDFLAAGRVVVGSESGSSVNDRRGDIQASIKAYLRLQPDATFEEVAERMPQGWDSYRFAAISPRHFEAVITRTCQVLVAGRYDGVFIAGHHYLPVRPDLADLGDVLQAASDPAVASDLAARSYEEIYRSGRYTYRVLAEQIDLVLDSRPPKRAKRGSQAPAVADRFGSSRLSRQSDLDSSLNLPNAEPGAALTTGASPWLQVLRLLPRRPGRRLLAGTFTGRVSRGLLTTYVRAGGRASSISANRLIAECRLLDHLTGAQAAQPQTPASRVVRAVAEGETLVLEITRKPPEPSRLTNDPTWPPEQILVRLPSFGGLIPDEPDEWGHSAMRLGAVGALAAIRPVPVHGALRQLLDTIGGARSRPRIRGARSGLKLLLATMRVLVARPGNLRLLAMAIGRAPLRDTADDLLKFALLRDAASGARLETQLEQATGTLCLATKPAGAPGHSSQISRDSDPRRILWDNSAISTYCAAPAILGRRVTVFVGAGGVHEFTAIEALPRSARQALLRQLHG